MFHGVTAIISNMASNVERLSFKCTYCTYYADSLSKRLDHYKYVHSNEPGFQIVCRVDDCPKVYQNVKSLYYHIKNKHPAAAQHLNKRNVTSRGVEVLQDLSCDQFDDSEMAEIPEQNDLTRQGEGFRQPRVEHDYDKQHAMFLLNMREYQKVPQSACNKISDQMQSVLEINNEQFGDRVNRLLGEKGCVTAEDIATLVAEQNAHAAEACERLNSAYKLDKYAHSQFDCVDPEDIVLGIGDDNKPRTMQYVPISKSLKQLLGHEDVLSQVLTGHASNDGKLRDFCDGTVYQENTLFKQYPNALQIQLYNDEFCVANALGYRQRKYKINALYYILGNLEPKHRSRLDMIQLVCLAKNIHVKEFGIFSLLQPVIEEIKQLETRGIIIMFEDRELHFYGTVSFLASDNLAAHFLARMIENFSTTLRLCRTCLITKHNLPHITSENKCQLRTRESYDEHARLATLNPDLATVYGVKQKSPLNELKHYHVIDGLPPCIAHDILEGVGPDLFEIIVTKLVRQGYFTLLQFQEKVNCFPYMGSDLANKPSVIFIDPKLKLRFTQSQNWCFVHLCPLMIGDCIPEGHPLWNVILLFLDMLDQILAPVISQRDLDYMQQTVEDFLSELKVSLPDFKIKAKAHYLLHCATLTKKFGPLIHCWTMRFEAEHNEHKQVSARTKNRINICKTMAKHKQSRQALHHAKENILDCGQYTDCVGEQSFPIQLLHRDIQSLLEPYLNGKLQVSTARSITVSGTKYRLGGAVVLGEKDGAYDFGKIEHIFIISGIPYMCCEKMNVTSFSEHYHSYMVEESSRFLMVQSEDLLDHHPLGLYQLHGKSFITLRYKLACI